MVIRHSQLHGSHEARAELQEFSLTSISYAPSARTPWHAHDTAMFVIASAGKATQLRKDRDQERKPGTYRFHPVGEPHADLISPVGLRTLVVELAPDFRDHLVDCGYHIGAAFEGRSAEACMIALRTQDAMAEQRSLRQHLRLRGLTYELLGSFLGQCVDRRPARLPRWLESAHDYIMTCYRERPSLEQIAAEVNVNPAHLARCFDHHYGISAVALVRKLVLEEAIRLLQESDKSVTEIASLFRYTPSHFSTLVQDAFGASPSKIRSK